RIALSRMRWDNRTQDHVRRRVGDGKTRREAIRCLKRYCVAPASSTRSSPNRPALYPAPPRLDVHRGIKHDPARRTGGNSRNGIRSKTVLTEVGPVRIDALRDQRRLSAALRLPPSTRPARAISLAG